MCNVSMSNWGPLMPCCVCRAVRGGAAWLLCWPGCLLHLRAEKFSQARTQGSQKTGDWWVEQEGKQWIFYCTALHLSKKYSKTVGENQMSNLFYRTIFQIPVSSMCAEIVFVIRIVIVFRTWIFGNIWRAKAQNLESFICNDRAKHIYLINFN